MKKKKLNKLSLNKNAIANLDRVSGGNLIAVDNLGTNLVSGCPDICPVEDPPKATEVKEQCATYTCSCYSYCAQYTCTAYYCPKIS